MSNTQIISNQNNRLFFPDLFLSDTFHGCFNRNGGVSSAPWDTLNVSFGQDLVENVKENRDKIKARFGIKNLVSAKQIHGCKVAVISEKVTTDFEVAGYDALITNQVGIGLMIQQADCQAVLVSDPIHKAAGIIHAGWRGSVSNIISHTIKALRNSFGSEPVDLKAAISPSLGPCCAEFINYKQELPPSFYKYQVKPNYFDFWSISCKQLNQAGLRKKNIEIAGKCTVCNPEYFSYRRDNITGRCASVIGLRK